MADNIPITTSGGTYLVRAEEDPGDSTKHQLMKLEFGAAGAFVRVADSDGARLPVKPATAGAAARTLVPDSAADVQILAANANRKGGMITNTSSAVLYLGLGAATVTLSPASYTVAINQDGLFVIPMHYTGEIRGLWATDPNDGGACVTELT